MIRGTTPTVVLKLQTDLQMSEMKQIWVTFKNLVHESTYNKAQIEIVDNSLVLQLSQEDTLNFAEGEVKVQVRLLTAIDKAYATNIKTLPVDQILKEGVIA